MVDGAGDGSDEELTHADLAVAATLQYPLSGRGIFGRPLDLCVDDGGNDVVSSEANPGVRPVFFVSIADIMPDRHANKRNPSGQSPGNGVNSTGLMGAVRVTRIIHGARR